MYIKCFILLANMKIIQSFFLFLLFSIVYGCSNGTDVSSLCFEKEYYEKPLLENPSEIMFSGGSNNLSVEVSDDNVLEATIGAGKIKIKTKKNGIVYLVVKDKTENTSVTIRVKVVDSYLGLQLGHPIPNYSVYNEDDRLYLVNDKSKSFYLYDKSFNLKATGNYKLFVKNSNFFLSLVFSDKVCFYNISNSSHDFLWGSHSYLFKVFMDE
ncbi:hypothetical protein DXB41_16205 [Segatella copri]|nr:hypothetical protein DXB41_16205 [Segatella copri]